MIDHDTTATFRSYPLVFGQWREGANRNIHVLRDAHGRQLEFVNVNNSAVESRTGTDMILLLLLLLLLRANTQLRPRPVQANRL